MLVTPEGLHIVTGHSASGSWKSAFGQAHRLAVQHDCLSCGPVPYTTDLAEFIQIRLEYLREMNPATGITDYMLSEIDLVGSTTRLERTETIYVWAGLGVEDQLTIAFVVHLLDCLGCAQKEFYVVQFEEPLDFGPITSLGMLNPEQFGGHPEPKICDDGAIQEYRSVWNAYASESPESLQSLYERQSLRNPALWPAIRCILRRYPHQGSGLSVWDKTLLRHVGTYGPKATRVIGHTLGSAELDWVGDSFLYHRLLKLANGREPLIKVSGGTEHMRDTRVELTEFGKLVAAGSASNYPANSIDDWIGGVHISSEAGAMWQYREGGVSRADEA